MHIFKKRSLTKKGDQKNSDKLCLLVHFKCRCFPIFFYFFIFKKWTRSYDLGGMDGERGETIGISLRSLDVF